MKTKMKALTLVLCAMLLVVASVMGTLAYLQSKTEVVRNTFTAGNVTITLDEAEVDEYGENANGRTTSGNEYKLIPGHEYVKDPTIHVKAGSEVCYLFVEVVDQITAIQADKKIADQMTENGWINLSGNVWYYKDTVDARTADEDIDVPVFGTFTVDGDAVLHNKDGSLIYGSSVITVTGYAVQADGFKDAAAAWAATYGAPATT